VAVTVKVDLAIWKLMVKDTGVATPWLSNKKLQSNLNTVGS
jgi:hypothetical protein